MTIIEQYLNRKIDVLALRGGTASGEQQLSQTLADADSGGDICTGIQKLAQRFLLVLLTEQGSVKYWSDYGTTFMTELRRGEIRTDAEMRAVFALAEQDAAEQLVAEESDTDPDDERYRHTELTTVTITDSTAYLYLTLESMASSADFIVPISLVV